MVDGGFWAVRVPVSTCGDRSRYGRLRGPRAAHRDPGFQRVFAAACESTGSLDGASRGTLRCGAHGPAGHLRSVAARARRRHGDHASTIRAPLRRVAVAAPVRLGAAVCHPRRDDGGADRCGDVHRPHPQGIRRPGRTLEPAGANGRRMPRAHQAALAGEWHHSRRRVLQAPRCHG